ncbi:DUF7343 domain-containing protein [Archaeoglobus sp.]
MDAEKRILEFLKRKGSALQSEIVKELGLAKSTVSEILRRLEGEGVIVRERIAGKSYRVWFFESSPKPCKILRVGILRASEYPHVILGLKMLGVRYHLKVFDSALELTKEIAGGRIDVGFSPFITQTVFALLLKSMKIHAVVALNGSGIAYKGDLRECKVFATSEFSAMESNLKLALETLGFDIYNLTFRYFDSIDKAINSFKSCEFDAIAIWEPYLQNFERVLHFKDVVGEYPCCSMASNVEFFRERRKELVELKKCIRDSIDEVGEDVAKKIAKLINFDWKLVYRSFDSYKFVCDLNEKYFRFLERYGLKLTQENIKSIADPL